MSPKIKFYATLVTLEAAREHSLTLLREVSLYLHMAGLQLG